MTVKNKISIKDFEELLVRAYWAKQNHPELRWGQAVLNALPEDLANEIRRSDLNPYNKEDNDWCTDFYQAITKEQVRIEKWYGFWTRDQAELNPDYLFLFGDNIIDYINVYQPRSTQAVIRGLPNALGVITKKNRSTHETAYFNDDDTESFKYWLDKTWNKLQEMLPNYRVIILPQNGIGTGAAKLQEKSPKCWELLQQFINKVKQL